MDDLLLFERVRIWCKLGWVLVILTVDVLDGDFECLILICYIYREVNVLHIWLLLFDNLGDKTVDPFLVTEELFVMLIDSIVGGVLESI